MPSSLAKIYIWRPSNITIYPTTPQGAKGPAPCSTSSVWMPATHRAPNRGGSGSEFPLAPRLASSGRTPGGRGNARANQRSMPQPDVGKHGKFEDFGGQMDGFCIFWIELGCLQIKPLKHTKIMKNLGICPQTFCKVWKALLPAFWSTSAAPPSPPVSLVGTQCSSKPVG